MLFAAFCMVIMLFPDPLDWLSRTFVVRSGAMEPTFKGGPDGPCDYLAIDRLSHRFTGLKRGDIIVFSGIGIPVFDDESYYVMRLAGLPGERIEIKDHAVYADGRRLTEADGIPPFAYLPAPPHHPAQTAQKEDDVYIVNPGEYFMLGDNSANSFDSRYWGGLPASSVAGKVSKIYYPFSRMGRVQ